jgi:hypothetical protein
MEFHRVQSFSSMPKYFQAFSKKANHSIVCLAFLVPKI